MLTNPGLVAVLAYDGLCTFEFGIAVEIFGLPRPEFEFAWYTHRIVAVDPAPMHAAGGMQVIAEFGLESLVDAHTIIIPGWRSRDERPPQVLLDALRAAYQRGARLLSICSGCSCSRLRAFWTASVPPPTGAIRTNSRHAIHSLK